MPQAQADRNLLFGILAVQMDFINREQLIAAMNAWVIDKGKPIGQILQIQGVLGAEDFTLLNTVVSKHIAKHGNDPARSLATFVPVSDLHNSLSNVIDMQVATSLGHLSRSPSKSTEYSTVGLTPSQAAAVGLTPSMSASTTGTRFRVLRPHARGGLGEVFVAKDQELNREVALKEIQNHYADHPESRSRFMLEAEITGALEHPGIVPVYGLGTYPDGRPYYAMRFIRGDSLQDALLRFHAADKTNRDEGERTIALRGLLRRFIDVCHAIAYAHNRGVIHRDIKPGNVMLGQFGETLVVDWGLAKPLGSLPETMPKPIEGLVNPASLANSTPTYVGLAVGTPQYMSPEQAAGRIEDLGPPSDVYSLGATMFCLLTGKPPFEGGDVGQMLVRVQKGEFAPPREVNSKVPAVLDAICRKAMSNKPEDRYSTPKTFAADLECWLADEPTSAWREPWPVRARRWANRHRTAVTSAVAALLVFGVSLGAATILLTAANAREREAKREAQEQRDEAASNYRLARSAVDRYHTEVSEDVLLHEPGMELLRRNLLEAAREFYKKFALQKADDPKVKAELGRALFRLAQITADIDVASRGIDLHKQALDIFSALAADSPDDAEILTDRAKSLYHQGRIQREVDQLANSRKSYEEALAIWTKLKETHPGDTMYLAEEARTRHGLGGVQQVLRKSDLSREEYGKALAIREGLVTTEPNRADFARDLAITRHNLAMVQATDGTVGPAEENYRKALAAQEKLARGAPNVTQYQADVARTHYNLADLYRLRGQAEDSVKEFGVAVSCWKKLADLHPAVGRFQAGHAKTLLGLCMAQRRAKDDAEAEASCKKAQEIYKQLAESGTMLPLDQAEVATGQRLMGNLYHAINKAEPARAAFQKSIELLMPLTQGKDALPEYSASLARTWVNLGFLSRSEKNNAAAEIAFRKALALWEPLVAAHPENLDFAAGLAVTKRHLAEIARDGGNVIAAIDLFGEAIKALESGKAGRGKTPEAFTELRMAYQKRAETFAEMNRPVEAVNDWERAVELAIQKGDLLWARLSRAVALGRIDEHVRAATEADAVAPEAKTTVEALFRLGCAYALAAGGAVKDQRLTSEERGKLIESYAAKAIDQLQKAADRGYFKLPENREKLKTSPDLIAIRGSEGYAALLSE